VRISIFSLLTLFVASSPAGETPWIPFKVVGKVVFVETKVNGAGPFLLIVDTGATETVLTPAVARKAGLKTWSVTPDQRKGIVKEISVGSVAARDLGVFVFDPPQALSLRLDHGIDYGGMLGYTFLSAFATTLDYPGRRIRFDPLGRKSASSGRGTIRETMNAPNEKHEPKPVPFELRDHLIHVEGTINGKGPVTMLLDTGSAEIMVLPPTARRLALALVQGGQRVGTPAAFTTLDELAIGDIRASPVPAVVGRLAWERSAGVTYDAIVGYPFLSNLAVTVNYRDRTVLLEPVKPR
jgi:predicted aspartyl protease